VVRSARGDCLFSLLLQKRNTIAEIFSQVGGLLQMPFRCVFMTLNVFHDPSDGVTQYAFRLTLLRPFRSFGSERFFALQRACFSRTNAYGVVFGH
jgi:hypothetical protein